MSTATRKTTRQTEATGKRSATKGTAARRGQSSVAGDGMADALARIEAKLDWLIEALMSEPDEDEDEAIGGNLDDPQGAGRKSTPTLS